VKVKRLFMLPAKAPNYAWVRKLDLSLVNLRKGKGMILNGGLFNVKYRSTVPDVEPSLVRSALS